MISRRALYAACDWMLIGLNSFVETSIESSPARFFSQPRLFEQVSKLKNEAGNEFTGRMEAMFNDMRVSVDTNESFREYSQNSREAETGAQSQARKDGGVELVAQVLTTGCWPSVSAKQEVRTQHGCLN